MNDEVKIIYVYADWIELKKPVLMGSLHSQFVRGKEIFSFDFSPDWLKSQSALALDPDLMSYAGRQYTDTDKQSFGIFMDSAPDRWGRQLIRRRETIRARHEKRDARQLKESDYLLEVHDKTRMGALRFKVDKSQDFLNSDTELPTPPWTSLRELETACRNYEKEAPTDSEHEKWLAMLLAPGSSLGGARPKANVLDNIGNLWIAKFPSQSDTGNIGAWEMVAHELAKEIGLNVPECRIEKFSKYGSTFLTKRFDRNGENRIHFSSAMTLLGQTDGDNYSTGCSYLDIAQFITKQGARPTEDLEELWQRIVFSISISNTDDHLRNHGFLLTKNGWILSPAYDINPNPHGAGLSLNISADDNSLDLNLALSIASHFRLNTQQAKEHISRITNIVNNWQATALKLEISRIEIEDMGSCFTKPKKIS